MREWKFKSNPLKPDESLRLQNQTGLPALVLQVCAQRGLTTALSIDNFLNPSFTQLTSPLTIIDMQKAVLRTIQALNNKEKIFIFGDYDVDGTTGAALLHWVFRDLMYENFEVRQGDRFQDGYGLQVRFIEIAIQLGAKLIITVDCGITSFQALEYAAQSGIDVIVLDHHQIDMERGLPNAFAIVNPQRSDCTSQLKQLCGCGLAFYFAMGLRSAARESGRFSNSTEPNLRQHLDLVVLATAADMVPLSGDNRILVSHGMEVLKKSKKPGIRALLKLAGIENKDLSPGHLGFVLGPRINASGRIQSAALAQELLTTTNPIRAEELAIELERLNRERSTIQNEIWDQVRHRIEKGLSAGEFKNGIVVADPTWHEGVIGIVASRITEMFRLPAVVISLREDFGKGSVRTFGGKDILQALQRSGNHLIAFGGHRHAAGLTIRPEKVKEFNEAFNEILADIPEDQDLKPLHIEGECHLADLDVKTLRHLERLAPFGPGNPEPVFLIQAEIGSLQVLKDRHLKLRLHKPHANNNTKGLEAIWFHAAERQEVFENGKMAFSSAKWAGVPELNRFRGNATPVLRVKDWREI